MKFLNKILLLSLSVLMIASCNIEDQPNPNGSSIGGFDKDATKSSLQTLVTGTESLLRQEIGFYYDVTSIIGREYYFFTGSDPRYTGEVLGKGDAVLDRAGFYGTRPYLGRYKTIKNLNIMLDAVKNTTLLTAEEAAAYNGFAKTLQAYEFQLALMLQYDNGIRMDVGDVSKLGPFLSYTDALAGIQSLLDEGYADLSSAGDAFPFKLSAGFDGFNTPKTFGQFNRAIASRIALYQGDTAGAISRLSNSFMDMAGDLNAGPGRFYSTAGGDFSNNLFRVRDQADAIIAHPTFVSDMTSGDARAHKVVERPSGALTLDGLTGTHDVWVYKSLNDKVPYIRNEELVLIYAEANLANADEAVKAINAVRNAAGIGDYTGATDATSLLNEILYQRRYSLFGEGHRWVDMRRLNRLSELPIDRPGDDVWPKMPVPISEN